MNRHGLKRVRYTVIEGAFERAVRILRAVGSDQAIREAMWGAGMKPRDLENGWKLLRAACDAPVQSQPARIPNEAEPKLAAFAKTIAPRTRTALRRHYPQQATFLLHDLQRGSRTQRLVFVISFLDRCDALAGSRRKSTRKADLAALAALAERGLTEEVRTEARMLTKKLMVIAPLRPAAVKSNAAALEALHAWVKDWSDCARSVITRRDWLIRLGIGKRKREAPESNVGVDREQG